MAASIIKSPIVNVNGNSATPSRWNAVHHPNLFNMTRQDFQVSVSGGASPFNPLSVTVLIGLGGGNISDFISVGQTIYLNNNNGLDGLFVVASVTNPDQFTLTNNTGLDYSTAAGYVNLLSRINYFIETKIYEIDDSNNDVFIGSSINKPSIVGDVVVDISSFLKTLVDYKNEFDYVSVNKKDKTLSRRYNITRIDNWVGFVGTETAKQVNNLYITNSAKQVGDKYGSNMGEYVPFTNYAVGNIRAKFLTPFKPTMFRDLPFSISFIYSEFMTGANPKRNIDAKGLNNTLISSTSDLLDTAQKPYVNRSAISVANADVKTLDVWLSDDTTTLTQKQKVKVQDSCLDNAIYLCWLNSLGGYSYFLFSHSFKETTNTSVDTAYKKPFGDLETSLGDLDITGKEVNKQLDFGANVNREDAKIVESLFISPKVFMLTNPKTWKTDGAKWVRVIVKQGSLTTFETKREFIQMSLSALLPTTNTQFE